MGIFGTKKKIDTVDEIPSFESTIINTKNLSDELESLAKKHNIATRELDFKLLSYKTFYTDSKSKETKEITELNRDEILIEDNILNPDISFSQELRVEIFKKLGKSTFPLSISIGGNKDLTNIRATIKPKDKITYFDGLDGEIMAELNKKKAKLGLMIGMMDESMLSGVKKLISLIRVNKKLKESVTLNICKGYEYIEHTKEQLIEHYLNDKSGENLAMHGVKEGDLVLEYIKAKDGRVGRNCKGEILQLKAVELSGSVGNISVTEDFEVQEEEDRILYIAKTKGFINVGMGNKYEIKDEFVIDSVSFKTTGDIDVGEESDVRVTIKEDDSMRDAVGPGVEIDTNELNVAGSVANNAKIKATIVQIKGQTHQSSHIEAKEVKIHLHKGYAEGDIVEIDILEGGVVVGDIVRVKQLSGGEIRAKEVYIDKVMSNSKISASHHIEFQKIEGNGNLFTIDSLAQRDFHKKYDEVTKNLSETELLVKKLPKELKQKKAKILSQKDTIDEIHKTIEDMKKFKKTPPASLILKLKEHQDRIKDYNSLLKELKDAKIQNDLLHEKLEELNTSVLSSKVVNKSSWREFNEVKFKLIEPPIEISFLPKEGEMINAIALDSTDEGDYQIKRG
jgi:flagellar hook protein FlgE